MDRIGRRLESRLRARLPARLITREGTFHVLLHDLSQHGACVTKPGLAPQHGDAVLQWPGCETFGRIVHSRPGSCGMRFDRPIPIERVIATRELDERGHLPEDFELERIHARDWIAGRTNI